MSLGEFLRRHWKHSICLTFLLLTFSTFITVAFPLETKIQRFFGMPFRMYGEGVFPWLGDLEDRKVFFIGGVFLNIFFWLLVSIAIVQLYLGIKSRRKKREG